MSTQTIPDSSFPIRETGGANMSLEEALRALVKSIYNDCIGDNTYMEQYKDAIQDLADAIRAEMSWRYETAHPTNTDPPCGGDAFSNSWPDNPHRTCDWCDHHIDNDGKCVGYGSEQT